MKKVLLSIGLLIMTLGVSVLAGCSPLEDVKSWGDQLFCEHTNTETVAAVEPTCTAHGYTAYEKCVDCGAQVTKREEIKATGHTIKVTTGYASICEDMGLTDEISCALCRKVIEEAKIIPPLGHSYDDGEVVQEATCDQNGKKIYTCEMCGATKVEIIPATGHSFTKEVVIAPTCTARGFTKHVCSSCGYSYEDTYVPALDHSYDDGVVVQEATCDQAGKMRYTCETCGGSKVEIIPATGHSYTTAVIAPTCTARGFTKHVCSCGDSYEDTYVPALGHEYTNYVSDNNATCTQDGTQTAECNHGCGTTDTRADEGTMLEHSYDDGIVVQEATCDQAGKMRYTCETCGGSRVELIPATGHSYTTAVTAPTCTTRGFTKHVCSSCGYSYEDTYVPAIGHEYTNYVSDNNATCTQDGTKTAECNHGCGTTDTIADEGTMLEHSYNDGVVIQEATCVENGKMRYTCETCGGSKVEIIPATGHSYTTAVIAPTCTARGFTKHVCSCGDSYEDTYVPALGHEYTNYVSDNNATCTQDGTKTAECNHGCGTTDTIADEGTMLGHSYDDGVVVQEATCDQAGKMRYTCETCGGSRVELITATGHSYTTAVIAPTCTARGFTKHTCVCGDSYEDTYVPALGHEYMNYVSDNNASCTQDGTQTAECNHGCGTTDTIADEGTMLEHSYDDGVVIQEATSDKAGKKKYTCETCGATKVELIPATGLPY